MDLSSLAKTSNIARGLGGIVLATPQSSQGIAAQLNPNNIPITSDTRSLTNSTTFLFHFVGEQSITLESDITDHYVEQNYAIQDQISIKPQMVTVNGFIGELNNVVPPILEPLKLAADNLVTLTPYLPQLSASAVIAYNQAVFAYQTAAQVANSAVQAWGTMAGGVQNKQQAAYTQFEAYWSARQLFTVNTPWRQFVDMAIKSLRAIQDAETQVITEFEITFKQMRFASTSISNSSNAQGRLANMAAQTVQKGTNTNNVPVPFSPTQTGLVG